MITLKTMTVLYDDGYALCYRDGMKDDTPEKRHRLSVEVTYLQRKPSDYGYEFGKVISKEVLDLYVPQVMKTWFNGESIESLLSRIGRAVFYENDQYGNVYECPYLDKLPIAVWVFLSHTPIASSIVKIAVIEDDKYIVELHIEQEGVE
jgi:hypothetical protein